MPCTIAGSVDSVMSKTQSVPQQRSQSDGEIDTNAGLPSTVLSATQEELEQTLQATGEGPNFRVGGTLLR